MNLEKWETNNLLKNVNILYEKCYEILTNYNNYIIFGTAM